MNARNDKTPDWLIERLALGELDQTEAAEVRRRLAAEGREPEATLAALATSNREILAEHPPAAIAGAVRARATKAAAKPSRNAIWLIAPIAIGAAAVVLVARPAGQAPISPGGDPAQAVEVTTSKGTSGAHAPRLYVYRRATGGSESLGDGAVAARGDVLQLAYTTGEPAFGVLLSLDGAGRVTVHLPDPTGVGAAAAVPLAAAREVRLPSAYELDDAPAFERFVLITADRPFPAAVAIDAARRLAANPGAARRDPLPLGPPLRQMSLALVKGEVK